MSAAEEAQAFAAERFTDRDAQQIVDGKALSNIAQVPTLGAPLFLDAAIEPMFARAAEEVAYALTKIGEGVLHRGEWNAHLNLSSEKRALMALDADQEHCAVWRFDCLLRSE